MLPQAAYVRRRDGTAACDLPFTMGDVKAAGGPHAFDSSASTKGEEARGVHEALEADGGALLAEVKAGWLRGGFEGDGLWPADADPGEILRRIVRDQTRARYRAIVEGAVTPVAATSSGKPEA